MFSDMYVAECAIDFLQNGIPAGEMLDRIDDMGVRDVASAHHGFKNLLSNLSWISVDKGVYGNKMIETRRGPIMQPEEKRTAFVKDLAKNFLNMVIGCWKYLQGPLLIQKQSYCWKSIED